MSEGSDGPMRVHAAVDVGLDAGRAFDVFVSRMASWWPAEVHVLPGDTCEVIVERHVGGRWFERTPAGEGGAELDWGSVVAYEPPGRLVLSWQLSPKAGWDPAVDEDPGMHHDPELRTELEIAFTSVAGHGTRVALEHRRLESLGEGPGADAIRALLAGDEVGWPYIMDHYARFAEKEEER